MSDRSAGLSSFAMPLPTTTRWGDRWDEATYPTPAPLLERKTKPAHDLFLDEAASYTWMCYAKLK